MEIKFIVQLDLLDDSYWLRQTVWTGEFQRADIYSTREQAQASLDRAKKFMKLKMYKAAKIVELQS